MAGTHTPPVRGGMNEEQVQSLNPIATARTGQNTLETTMQDDIETETTIGALIAEKTADGTNAEEAGVEVEAEVQIGGAERTTIQGDPMRKREMLSLLTVAAGRPREGIPAGGDLPPLQVDESPNEEQVEQFVPPTRESIIASRAQAASAAPAAKRRVVPLIEVIANDRLGGKGVSPFYLYTHLVRN
ncbi:hypothetical protein EMMF5_000324 [Cystobasidiomycetes sp. EMM_F5]